MHCCSTEKAHIKMHTRLGTLDDGKGVQGFWKPGTQVHYSTLPSLRKVIAQFIKQGKKIISLGFQTSVNL